MILNPKEKAIELIHQFMLTENEYKEHCDFIQAKQCALIAVDEIMNSFDVEDDNDKYSFYIKVKTEINNL